MRCARAIVLSSAINLVLGPAVPLLAADPTTQPTTRPAVTTIPVPATQPLPPLLPTTRPTARPVAAAPTTQPEIGVTLAPGGGLILNFKDASIDTALEQLSDVGRFIIVKETKLDGRVTLVSKQPVNSEEAVALLNTALKTNGYAAIQMGRILKVLPRDKAKRSNIPVRSGSDPLKIEPTDELITQVIPIRFADAVQLKNDLAPMIGTDADFSANASSNSVIITDSAANIRRITEIISALDTHMADSSDVKVFRLKNASAANTARLITDVFKEDTQSQNRSSGNGGMQMPGFMRGMGFPGAQGGGRGGSGNNQSQGSRQTIKVSASADDRTNTVVVTGPSDVLLVVERVVKELDADPTEQQSVFVYSLKNAQAINLESVINNLFNSTGGSSYRGTSSGSYQNRNTQQRSSGSSSFGNRSSSGMGNRSGGSSFGSTSGFGSTGGFGGSGFNSGGFNSGQRFGGGMGGLSSSASRSAADLAGQVYVVAEADTNALLVMTSPKNYERVKQILDELDRAVPQVLIKVLLAEVTHDNSRDLGAEFSILNLRTDANGNVLGQKGGTDFGLANSSGGLVVQVLENNLTTTLRALENAGKLDVLSRPYILASDNQLASITVGQEVPFVQQSRTTDEGDTIDTISYEDIGILLDVIPHINPKGLVIMDVRPEISALTNASVTVSGTQKYPVYAKRSAQSRVSIQDGQTIVIGGLMEDRKNDSVSKVPLLGDIPLIGALFQRVQTTKSKTELLIFLTPHVAQNNKELGDVSQGAEDGIKVVPQAVEPGTFEDHMKALRHRGTTQPAE
ncbi:MAG TPA: type II secretion system secretin GspD [Tepidisphaeraceae bacterium]|nr:type II secretion system secretin GspD [Tepidisphaeraceae bacterium]